MITLVVQLLFFVLPQNMLCLLQWKRSILRLPVFDGSDTYHCLPVVIPSRNYNQIINLIVVRICQIRVCLSTIFKLNHTENQIR